MKRLTLATLFAFGVVSAVGGAEPVAMRRESIPDRFVGVWSTKLALCTRHEDDTTALKISSDAVVFWEDGGHTLAVATRGESELVVVLEMGYEDGRYLDAIRFVLSKDKNHLSIMSGQKVFSTRVRCPKNASD